MFCLFQYYKVFVHPLARSLSLSLSVFVFAGASHEVALKFSYVASTIADNKLSRNQLETRVTWIQILEFEREAPRPVSIDQKSQTCLVTP